MSQFSRLRLTGLFILCVAGCAMSASAQEIKTVFVIAMENHNWTQPANSSPAGSSRFIKIPTRHSLTVL